MKLPLHPKHPERVCWGCDLYCSADELACGNGSERTQHPIELFGPDWHEWSQELQAGAGEAEVPTSPTPAPAPAQANSSSTGAPEVKPAYCALAHDRVRRSERRAKQR